VATLLVTAVVVATLVECAPTAAAELAADIAAALALVADTAVAELAADLAAAVTLAADSVAAAMVAAADTGKFRGFNRKGPSASAGGPFLFV
jgi:predicted transcriptional regulator